MSSPSSSSKGGRPQGTRPGAKPAAAPGAAPGARTLMIVDDDDKVCQVLKKGFEHAGYRVLVADNGLKLVATLRTDPVDAVLLDINMPWVSGLQVGRAIKADPGLAHIKVIYITGLPGQEEECRQNGGDGFFQKPPKLAELLSTLRLLLAPPPG